MVCVRSGGAGSNRLRRRGSDIAVQVVQEIQGDEGDVRAVSRIWRILHEGVFTFIHYIC